MQAIALAASIAAALAVTVRFATLRRTHPEGPPTTLHWSELIAMQLMPARRLSSLAVWFSARISRP